MPTHLFTPPGLQEGAPSCCWQPSDLPCTDRLPKSIAAKPNRLARPTSISLTAQIIRRFKTSKSPGGISGLLPPPTQQLASPPHLATSLFGRQLPPVALSNAPSRHPVPSKGCSRGQRMLRAPGPAPATRRTPGALRDPLEDISLGVLFKPCVLKSPGCGLWTPPKALSHQTEICRDFTTALGMSKPFHFEEPWPAPSSITERAKTSPRV